jgi:phosphatidylglycerophosphate synthase
MAPAKLRGVWVAHALTLSRVAIAVAFAVTYGDPTVSVCLLGLAALTDTADGTVARWMQRHGHTEPDIGGWLDPLVDKVFVAIVLATIWLHGQGVAALALVGARELLFVPLAAIFVAQHRSTRDLHADWLGKLATVAQFFAIAVIVAEPSWSYPAAIAAGSLGVAAFVHYLAQIPRRSAA